MTDTDAIMDLLTPLAVAGITRMRTRQDILQDLCQFTVVERENKVCSTARQARPCESSALPHLPSVEDLSMTAHVQA